MKLEPLLIAVLICIALFLPEVGHCAGLIEVPKHAAPWLLAAVALPMAGLMLELLEEYGPFFPLLLLGLVVGVGSLLLPLLFRVAP